MKRKKKPIKSSKTGEFSTTFFTAIQWMRFKDGLEVGRSKIIGQGSLVTDRKAIRELITEDVKKSIGTIEYGFLKSCPIVMITQGKPGDVLGNPGFSANLLELWMKWEMGILLLGLWVVKENSITPDTGYLIVEKNRKLISSHSWITGTQFVNCQGGRLETEWDKKEVNQANDFSKALKELLRINFYPAKVDFSEAPEVADELGVPEWKRGNPNLPKTAAKKGASRVERFFYLLWTTIRNEHDLGFRITYMIQALETLFATSHGELTYRLSLRVALLFSNDQDEQFEISQLMKECYAIRSAMIHGGSFDPKKYSPGKTKDIAVFSKQLEDLVRKIARRILEDSEFCSLLSAESHNIKNEDTKKSLEEIFTKFVFTRKLPEIEGGGE